MSVVPATAATAVRAPFVDEPCGRAPDAVTPDGSRTWSMRGRNFVVSLTELSADDPLAEHDLPDEYALLVTDGGVVVVEHAEAGTAIVTEPAFVVVPAGTSTVRASSPTTVTRVFSDHDGRSARRAVNDADEPDTRTAPLAGPDVPVSGRIRVHPLSTVPNRPGRFGRIFRTSSVMVNWFPEQAGPRDPEALSPHSHADFEQLSLTLEGDFVHHFRTPWSPRMSEWRDDQHVAVGSPSMVLIPPTVVHTTRAVGPGRHTLVDVFAPPRGDFLAKGWVLNADEYRGVQP